MEHKACCENYLEKQMENFSRLLEDYFDNILQEFIKDNPDFMINGYSFNRDNISDQYHWSKININVYATPFYDADTCLKIYYEKDYDAVKLQVTGNAEKDLKHYFEVMKYCLH